MSDTSQIEVVESSILLFVDQVVEAINKGYYVRNTVKGYPMFMAYGNYITLFAGDKPEATSVLAGDRITIHEYGDMEFMLALQNAALQGFVLDTEGVSNFAHMKLCTMYKPEPAVVEEEKPKQKVRAKKALVAEPTIAEMKEESSE